jgi:CheY-like chemotaxis protein
VVPSEIELSNCRVLIVEDEALVSMLLEDMLADIGCIVVGVAARFAEALEKTASLSFDVAILDVNLNGEPTFRIAEALDSRGSRFLFSTGYGATVLPPHFQSAPVLQKPFAQRDLEQVLRAALA